MSDKLLVSFGCSWTYGRFIHWKSDQKKTDHATNNTQVELELANTHAYRSLIAKHLHMDQQVFAEGGSSNQRQFRLASQYFFGPDSNKINNAKLYTNVYQKIRDTSWPSVEEFKFSGKLSNQIVEEIVGTHKITAFELFKSEERPKYVIWFITSTARIEFFDAQTRQYKNKFLSWPEDQYTRMFASQCYDHNHELENLAHQMNLWNAYFQTQGIKNIWVDTFNHHDYPIAIENYVKISNYASDIMSNMCVKLGYITFNNDEFHTSGREADDTRSKFLADQGMLNPETLHPTIQGHQLIADILIPIIEEKFNSQNDR
jgi:hypothetical protein